MARAACHWGSSVANDASGEPGEISEYLSLATYAGLCVGGPFISLAARGIRMENKFSNLIIHEEGSKKSPSVSVEREIVPTDCGFNRARGTWR